VKLYLRMVLAAVAVVQFGLLSVKAQAADDLAAATAKSGKHNQLLHALRLTGLEANLKGTGPFTVLAPTDEAFGKLPKGALFRLLQPENKQLLTAVLNYHIIRGDYPSQRLTKASAKQFALKSLEGANIEFNVRGAIKAAGATVGPSDIRASNGVVLPVDTVLLPPKVRAALAARPYRGS
jgi:uncharacterized surface protein with fasciclin (FAS1) repeats